jgi:cell division protein FtsI/penicillin-binding protein 2/cell division protein FtsW (lipid II flippase)
VLTVEQGGPPEPWRAGRSRRLRWKRKRFRGWWRLPRLGAGAWDVLAIVAMLVLVGLGVLNLYAVGGRTMASHQLVTAVGGLVLFAVLWWTGARFLTGLGWVCYGMGVLFLVAVLGAGVRVNGAQRWLAVGSFTFQPSELIKLGLLIVLSAVLGSSRPVWQRFTLAVLLAVVPIALTGLEPDLSTATVLVLLTVTMLIVGRVPMRLLLPLFGAGVVLAPLAVGLLRPYQLARLTSFLSAAPQSADSGWAVFQAHVALASGGLLGWGNDPAKALLAQYLPDRETDLALASLTEQWGLIAGGLAVAAAIVLVWRLALASRVPRTRAGGLAAAGFALLLAVETLVSLGGNLGLLPVAGVPFPLVSYGGTAVVVHLAALGIVLAARRDGVRRRLWSGPSWRHARPRLVRAAALAMTGVLAGFAFYGWNLRASQGDALRLAGQSEMTRCVTVPAPRGIITDRHGQPLASGISQDTVSVVPALLRSHPADITRLASLLGQSPDALRATLSGAPVTDLSLPVGDVAADVGSRITAAGIGGVLAAPKPTRSYPTGPLLAPVLGFVGVATPAEVQRWPGLPPGEMVGRTGVEASYDAVLRGVDGRDCVDVDVAGVPVAQGPITPPSPGANLRLSIDLGLQRELVVSLAEALAAEPLGGLGAAVAMDPKTGAVLAMASLPSYDDNLYGPPVNGTALEQVANRPGQPMLEHVTQAQAPPGSTFKLVVAAADMVHPVLDPATVIPTGASYTLGGHTFNNWSALPPQNLVQAIAWSNDVYFYKLANALGADALTGTATAMGVGQQTGIDLPGESGGYLGTPQTVSQLGATWYPGSTVILGIGQGYLEVTPLQDARWTAAAATGTLVTPRLGLATGTSTYTALPAAGAAPLPFAGSLGPVRDGMRAAVTSGTAARLDGLPTVGAKTGTAEDTSSANGGLDDWMTAAAPMNDPSIVITSMVQGPGEGATSAGPVVQDGLSYYFGHQAQVLAAAPAQPATR